MTSMIHKVVDARRARRQRYKKYIDVFRARFHCTAGEVLGRIEGAIHDANKETSMWKRKAEAFELQIASLKDQLLEARDLQLKASASE